MKTTKEKIAVMRGFFHGEKIEVLQLLSDRPQWNDYIRDKEPIWDWSLNDYRIKEEPKIISFTHVDDLLGMKVMHKKSNMKYLITSQHDNGIYINSSRSILLISYQSLLNDYLQLDGSPCGKIL